MIQIDMDKPKDCIWADITNHIYHCPLLNGYHKCNLQDSEPSTIKEQYERCPLHEAAADHNTVSKQAVIENVCTMLRNCFDASDEMIESVKITVGELPPLTEQTTSRSY